MFVTMADKLIKGETIQAGTEIPGLGVVNPEAGSTNLIVDQLVELNKDTVDDLAAMGL